MIDYKAIYKRAKKLASTGHAKDFRNDGTTPYIDHINWVDVRAEEIARQIEPWADESMVYGVKIVAQLHDLHEDHPAMYPLDIIEKKLLGSKADAETIAYVKLVVRGVDAISKKPKDDGERYSEYVARVLAHIWARISKLADIEHNSLTLLPGSRLDKYDLTTSVLRAGLSYK